MIAFIYLCLLPFAIAILQNPAKPAWVPVNGYEVDTSLFLIPGSTKTTLLVAFKDEIFKQMGYDHDSIPLIFLTKDPKSWIISDNGNGLSWRPVQPNDLEDERIANANVKEEEHELHERGFFVPTRPQDPNEWYITYIAIIDSANNRVLLRNPLCRAMFPSLWTNTTLFKVDQKSIDDGGSGSRSSHGSEQ